MCTSLEINLIFPICLQLVYFYSLTISPTYFSKGNEPLVWPSQNGSESVSLMIRLGRKRGKKHPLSSMLTQHQHHEHYELFHES